MTSRAPRRSASRSWLADAVRGGPGGIAASGRHERQPGGRGRLDHGHEPGGGRPGASGWRERGRRAGRAAARRRPPPARPGGPRWRLISPRRAHRRHHAEPPSAIGALGHRRARQRPAQAGGDRPCRLRDGERALELLRTDEHAQRRRGHRRHDQSTTPMSRSTCRDQHRRHVGEADDAHRRPHCRQRSGASTNIAVTSNAPPNSSTRRNIDMGGIVAGAPPRGRRRTPSCDRTLDANACSVLSSRGSRTCIPPWEARPSQPY